MNWKNTEKFTQNFQIATNLNQAFLNSLKVKFTIKRKDTESCRNIHTVVSVCKHSFLMKLVLYCCCKAVIILKTTSF